uniref:Cobalamin adenosyltransferase-like domain-containing protein n=1 Tax=Hucho hucho TaxID=62062 RepID=A0A4W5QLG7_9TELE
MASTITKISHLRCILRTGTCLTVNWTKTSTKLDSRKPKMYTKTGDKGEYSSKSLHIIWSFHQRKLCSSSCHTSPINVGSNIATPRSYARESHKIITHSSPQPVAFSFYSYSYLTLSNREKQFPSVGKSSAALHIARTVCRQAELRSGEADPDVATFFNRLSDYLFTVARYTAMKEGKDGRKSTKDLTLDE